MVRKNILDQKNYIIMTQLDGTMTKTAITPEDRLKLIKGSIKEPGSYNLGEEVNLFTKPAQKFNTSGEYFHIKDIRNPLYKKYWDTQKEYTYNGFYLAEKNLYIPGACYWYINFCIIEDKVKELETFPVFADFVLWYYQIDEKEALEKQFTAIVKARQKGVTTQEVARVLRNWYFQRNFNCRIATYTEDSMKQIFNEMLPLFRSHLEEHTAWKRSVEKKGNYNWKNTKSTASGKIRGNQSILAGKFGFIKSKTKLAGGRVSEFLIDEAGLFPSLKKALSYGEPAIMMGDVITGRLKSLGATGEMAQSEDLRDIFYNPPINYAVYDEGTCLFIPAWMMYFPYVDKYGNSLKEESIASIQAKYDVLEEKGDLEAWSIYKAQNPLTPEDALQNNIESIFPREALKRRKLFLEQRENTEHLKAYKYIKSPIEGEFGTLINVPLYKALTKYKIDVKKDRSSAIVIKEEYLSGHKYLASVDTISPIEDSTAPSLQSTYIWKLPGFYGKEVVEYPTIVAWYTGRTKEDFLTFETSSFLIDKYKAKAAIENNNRNFIVYLLGEKKAACILKKSDFPITKDIIVNTRIKAGEYGLNMTSPTLIKYGLGLLLTYVVEKIGVQVLPNGKESKIWGLERIDDLGLVNELIKYNSKGNFDRVSAIAVGLIYISGMDSRGLFPIKKKTEPVKQLSRAKQQKLVREKMRKRNVRSLRDRRL